MKHQTFQPPTLTMLMFIASLGGRSLRPDPLAADSIATPTPVITPITNANARQTNGTAIAVKRSFFPTESCFRRPTPLFPDGLSPVSRNVVRHYLSGSSALLWLMLPSRRTEQQPSYRIASVLLAIVEQANKDKTARAKQIDNATKQMGIEIRALRRIQDRQLEAAGILPKG
jgi:hypothetical protein